MQYILYHLEIVWAFVRGDDEALYRIDATPRGVLLSFLAIVIVEPLSFFYAALFGFLENVMVFRDGGLPYYLLQLVLDWGLPPVLFLVLGALFGFRDRLVPLIVSYNWLNVIIFMLTLLPGALMTTQLIGLSLSLLLMLAVYGVAIWLSYRLFRFVLDIPPAMAFGMAILMLTVSIGSAMYLAGIAADLV